MRTAARCRSRSKLRSSNEYRVPGAWCRVPGAWCRVPSAGCQCRGAKCRGAGFKGSGPVARRRDRMASSRRPSTESASPPPARRRWVGGRSIRPDAASRARRTPSTFPGPVTSLPWPFQSFGVRPRPWSVVIRMCVRPRYSGCDSSQVRAVSGIRRFWQGLQGRDRSVGRAPNRRSRRVRDTARAGGVARDDPSRT